MVEKDNNQTEEAIPDIFGTLLERVDRLESQFDSILSLVGSKKSQEDEGEKDKDEGEKDQKDWLKQIESLSKISTSFLSAIAGTAAIFYACGFVIVNMYLSTFGVRDFELIKPTYLAAGIVFVVANLIIVSLPVIVQLTWIYVFESEFFPAGTFVMNKDLFIMLGSLLSYLLAYALIFAVLTKPRSLFTISGNWWPPSLLVFLFHNPIHFISLFFCIPFIVAVGLIGMSAGRNQWFAKFSLAGQVYLLFLIPIVLVSWGLTVYPKINPAFSGGEPITVQLVLSDTQKADLFKSIGIDVVGNVTQPLKLIDESSQSVIVIVDDNNAAKLDRGLIANIIYKSGQSP